MTSPSRALRLASAMLKTAAALLVFLGGFALMVLEIIGARYLAKDFGGAFYFEMARGGRRGDLHRLPST